MDVERLEKTLIEINEFGNTDKGVTRLAYSLIERQAVERFSSLCEQAGMTVRMDPCGNLIARREGIHPDWPAVAIGSHLDTVIQGGKYDGALGVVAALEVIRSLNDHGVETEYPIEIIAFACEESSRFGVSTVGSKAMAGVLNKELISGLKDKEGLSVAEAFSKCGLHFEVVEQSTRSKKELKAFFELHIEQGPVLENEGKQIGIATGIAAPSRYEINVQGHASHSGTTPMNSRKDAFLGAAEIALELEKAANMENAYGTVATVGMCEVKPGAMNVVPDAAELKLDIRGTSIESKNRVINRLFDAIHETKKTRGLQISINELSNEIPVILSDELIESLGKICEQERFSYKRMPSGAGHDAMNMALLCPTGLIFVPSKNGISHHRDEYTPLDQIVAGVTLLEKAILKWAGASRKNMEGNRRERVL
ncbi:Zn-dependent hydrolase [Paenibacillus sp. R14(2021)]|uniref:Zn-dependent hydrolase n=1 Tax=Paenibacillus sp. R14(2021) TaxID=2859228 RepID=UPI00280BB2E6|nr:Zn-dependent hydrolase [Paenibacillus sp. R14(2021)]